MRLSQISGALIYTIKREQALLEGSNLLVLDFGMEI